MQDGVSITVWKGWKGEGGAVEELYFFLSLSLPTYSGGGGREKYLGKEKAILTTTYNT